MFVVLARSASPPIAINSCEKDQGSRKDAQDLWLRRGGSSPGFIWLLTNIARRKLGVRSGFVYPLSNIKHFSARNFRVCFSHRTSTLVSLDLFIGGNARSCLKRSVKLSFWLEDWADPKISSNRRFSYREQFELVLRVTNPLQSWSYFNLKIKRFFWPRTIPLFVYDFSQFMDMKWVTPRLLKVKRLQFDELRKYLRNLILFATYSNYPEMKSIFRCYVLVIDTR